MKKQIFTIFGFGLIIGALFFGGYTVYSASIQDRVGNHRIDTRGSAWWPDCSVLPGIGDNDGEIPFPLADPNICREPDVQAMTYILNGTSWDRMRSVGVGDGAGTGIAALGGFVFNGTTWDRVRSASGDALSATGLTGLGNFVFNGTTWDRMRSASADALASTGIAASGNMVFNGTTWDQARSVLAIGGSENGTHIPAYGTYLWGEQASTWARQTAANSVTMSDNLGNGVALTTPFSAWSETDSPAAATQAIASKAAGAASIHHVVTSVTACFTDSDTLDVGTINLRDGATGAGTVIWSAILALPVPDDSKCISKPLTILGSAATAMTLEFAAAGSANSLQTVTLTGYSID